MKKIENNVTTIKLNKETKKRLDNIKEYHRETYNETLENLLEILNVCRISPERARQRLLAIDRHRRRKIKQIKIQKTSVETEPKEKFSMSEK